MSKIEEFFAIDDTVEYYKQNITEAISAVELMCISSDFCKNEASRIDALELACAIIALASQTDQDAAGWEHIDDNLL